MSRAKCIAPSSSFALTCSLQTVSTRSAALHCTPEACWRRGSIIADTLQKPHTLSPSEEAQGGLRCPIISGFKSTMSQELGHHALSAGRAKHLTGLQAPAEMHAVSGDVLCSCTHLLEKVCMCQPKCRPGCLTAVRGQGAQHGDTS